MKLSEFMKLGATLTTPTIGTYFEYEEPDQLCTCAMGAAMYAMDTESANEIDDQDACIPFVLEVTGLDLNLQIDINTLPQDVREKIPAYSYGGFVSLHDLITATNDQMSRERAIQLVEELGY